MNEYERQQQLMELQEEMLDELLDDPSDEEEAEEVIDEVFDAIGIELNSKLVSAPKTKMGEKQTAVKSDEDAELTALLHSL